MKTCVIVSAGEFFGEIPEIYDFLIAVDAGLRYCINKRLKPDLIIGDFDSLEYIPNSDNVIRLNQDKDQSDTFFAVDYAVKMGYDNFHIFGGTGGRFSHTMANVQTLQHLSELGKKNLLYDKEENVTVISNGECVEFPVTKNGYVSLLSLTSESVITTKGLKYEVSEATITDSYPYALSNEFIGKESVIIIHKGIILVAYTI